MKKKMKRFLPVLACFVLLSGLFSVSVSAEDIDNEISITQKYGRYYSFGTSKQSYSSWNTSSYTTTSGAPIDGVSKTDTFGINSTSYIYQHPYMDYTIKVTDKDNGVLVRKNGSASLEISNFLFHAREYDTVGFWYPNFQNLYDISVSYYNGHEWLMFSDFDVEFTDGTGDYKYNIYYDFIATENIYGIEICFTYNAVSLFGLPSNKQGFVLNTGYMEKVSIDVNDETGFLQAPNYVKPDGGKLEEMEDIEDELGTNAEEGFDAINGNVDNFVSNITGFVAGLQFMSTVMHLLIVRVPFAGSLVYISLGLGMFGLICGLAGAIISANDRKVTREKIKKERYSRSVRNSKRRGG